MEATHFLPRLHVIHVGQSNDGCLPSSWLFSCQHPRMADFIIWNVSIWLVVSFRLTTLTAFNLDLYIFPSIVVFPTHPNTEMVFCSFFWSMDSFFIWSTISWFYCSLLLVFLLYLLPLLLNDKIHRSHTFFREEAGNGWFLQLNMLSTLGWGLQEGIMSVCGKADCRCGGCNIKTRNTINCINYV